MFECCENQNLVDCLGGLMCITCGNEYLLVYPRQQNLIKYEKRHVYNSKDQRVYLLDDDEYDGE